MFCCFFIHFRLPFQPRAVWEACFGILTCLKFISPNPKSVSLRLDPCCCPRLPKHEVFLERLSRTVSLWPEHKIPSYLVLLGMSSCFGCWAVASKASSPIGETCF